MARTGSSVAWRHQQQAPNLYEVSEAALARALAKDWTSEPMEIRVAHLRALYARSVVAAAILTTAQVPPPGLARWTAPRFERSTFRATWGRDAAELLMETPILVARMRSTPGDAWADVQSTGGAPATRGGSEAGNPLLLGVVVVAGVAASTVALCYTAQKTAELIDRELERDAAAKTLLATQASAIRIVEAHTAAELEAGEPLPLNAAEQQALDALLETQRQVAAQRQMPLSSPFPSGADVARGSSSALKWIAGAAAVVGVLYFGVFRT